MAAAMAEFFGSLRRVLLCGCSGPGSRSCIRDWNLTLEEVADYEEEEEECSICLAQLSDEVARTQCGHRFHLVCLERNFRATRRTTCPLCRRSLCSPLGISARAMSGRAIEVLEAVPHMGSRCHLDRDYRFLLLGDFARLHQMVYIATSNEDKRIPTSDVMWMLDTTVPVTVHLNFRSERHVLDTGVLSWIQEKGWARSSLVGTVSTGVPDGLYWGPVYSKNFGPGSIPLMGSNCMLGTYFVFVQLHGTKDDDS